MLPHIVLPAPNSGGYYNAGPLVGRGIIHPTHSIDPGLGLFDRHMALCSHTQCSSHSSQVFAPSPFPQGASLDNETDATLFVLSRRLATATINQFCAPPHHAHFIRQALWLRLLVGERQKNWKPHEVWCPLDGESETMEHTLTQCSLVKVTFDTVSKCIPYAWGDDLPPALLKVSLAQSFQCPTGFLA